MAKKLRIDKAGRLVIPKAYREALGLDAGCGLVAERSGDQIILRPSHEAATFRKEKGCWVYRTGRRLEPSFVDNWIEAARDERISQAVP